MRGITVSRQKRVKLRQKGASIRQKISWALYEKKNFDRLIEDITVLVDGLVDIFPEETRKVQREMATIEISEIKETPSAELLVDLAGNNDKILRDVGKKFIEDRMGHEFRENVRETRQGCNKVIIMMRDGRKG